MSRSQALRLLRVLRSSSSHLPGIPAIGVPETQTLSQMPIRGISSFRGYRPLYEAAADAFLDSNASASTKLPNIAPPYRADDQFADDWWNYTNPGNVVSVHTPESNGQIQEMPLAKSGFFRGRDMMKDFMRKNFRMQQEDWRQEEDREISVCLEFEWPDAQGQWWRSHEIWEKDSEGLMQCLEVSDDYKIDESERKNKVE